MKRLARETENSTRDIVATATNHLPPAAAVKMPGVRCLKQTTRREKNRAHPIQLLQPANLSELVIPDDLVQLPNGESFLLFDSGPEAGNRRQAARYLYNYLHNNMGSVKLFDFGRAPSISSGGSYSPG